MWGGGDKNEKRKEKKGECQQWITENMGERRTKKRAGGRRCK